MADAVSPRQRRIFEEVFGVGVARPTYGGDMAAELRSAIEEPLRADVAALQVESLRIGKSAVSRMHACEGYYVAQRQSFEHSPRLIAGKLAHRMVQVCVGATEEPPSLQLADRCYEELLHDDGYRSDEVAYLRGLSQNERSDIKTGATNAAVQFFSDWPMRVRGMKPRVEHKARVDLLDGKLRLFITPDLLFGSPNGDEARVVLVDMKSGTRHPSHIDDLRFYALVQTLRDDVPPFRIVSYYLETGEVHAEDVSPETLHVAARRVVDAVRKMIELDAREPKLNAGWHCRWCSARRECEPGRLFLREAGRDEDPAGDDL